MDLYGRANNTHEEDMAAYQLAIEAMINEFDPYIKRVLPSPTNLDTRIRAMETTVHEATDRAALSSIIPAARALAQELNTYRTTIAERLNAMEGMLKREARDWMLTDGVEKAQHDLRSVRASYARALDLMSRFLARLSKVESDAGDKLSAITGPIGPGGVPPNAAGPTVAPNGADEGAGMSKTGLYIGLGVGFALFLGGSIWLYYDSENIERKGELQ